MPVFGNGEFHVGDCFDVMATLPDASVDMVLCDLPYGTTTHKNKQGTPTASWDDPLDFTQLWNEYCRLIKPCGNIVLTASQPFTARLVLSKIDWFKYNLVWKKNRVSGHLSATFRPLSEHEDICVFSPGGVAMNSRNIATYNPQNLVSIEPKARTGRKTPSATARTVHEGKGFQTKTGYPRSVLDFASESNGFHPTQKPVALFEYLIRTYTDEGMTVLDNTAGSGTTAIAAERSNRRWICIERDEGYAAAAQRRIMQHLLGDLL